MRFLVHGLLASAAIAGLAGCGGDSEREPGPAASTEQRGILETVDKLQAASRRGDGEQICTEIFTTGLARSVAASSRTSCAREVRRKLFSPEAELTVGRDLGRRGPGGRVVATVMDQAGQVSTLALVELEGTWRIEKVTPGGTS